MLPHHHRQGEPQKLRSAKVRRPSRRRTSAPAARLGVEALEERTLLNGSQFLASYGQIPLSFTANQGQTDPSVQFVSQGNGYGLFLRQSDAVLMLNQPPAAATGHGPALLSNSAPQVSVLDMQLVGASTSSQASGLNQQAGAGNYLIGNNQQQWLTNVPMYGQVEYQNVYPGINLTYQGTSQEQLSYDFQLAAGANPNQIQLNFQGASLLATDAQGDLVVTVGSQQVIEQAPLMYQTINGRQQAVTGAYVIDGPTQVGFNVGTYDPTQPLVIDPTLDYSTYLGGSGADFGTAIAVDSADDTYVTGYTVSSDFPTNGALQGTIQGNYDAFVTKLNPAGNAIVYSTYLGGSGYDRGTGIAVDAAGDAYVTGTTGSANFPTQSPIQSTLRGTFNAFVTKLNPAGSGLVYSTYLGGSGRESVWGIYDSASVSADAVARDGAITVDSTGNAWVTGDTNSPDFPTTANAFQTTYAGSTANAFVTRINAAGTALDYSSYLGGSGLDGGRSIAVDAAGKAYIAGWTSSGNFPTTANAFQRTYGGGSDGWAAKIDPTQSGAGSLVYSTYLGGSAEDEALGVAVDSAGNAYVAGVAASTNFPTTPNAFQTNHTGGVPGTSQYDAFVTKLNPTGTGLVYSTYIGGNAETGAFAVAVDPAGSAYVAGFTTSSNYPTAFPTQASYGGGSVDAVVTRLDPTGSTLLFSTFLGGSGQDWAEGIALDGAGHAYVVGSTTSTNFPTVNAFQTSNAGGTDAFVSAFGGVPYLTSLSQTSATEGAAALTLTVTGGGFSNTGGTPSVDWNGTALSTTFVSGTRLQATIPAADFADEGAASITVVNPDSTTTNSQTFTVADAPLSIAAVAISAATGNVISNQPVATFTDQGGAEDVSHYVASIQWGDNSTSTGTISYASGVFTVAGSHTYAQAGTYSVQVTVSEGPAHRYSFTSDASDSIGGANGTLQGNATISNGAVNLDGTSGTYVNLPAYILPTSGSLTLEAWGTYINSGYYPTLFTFGNTDSNAQGSNSLWLSAEEATNPNIANTGISDSDPTTVHNQVARVSASSPQIVTGRLVQTDSVFDETNGLIKLYINGILVAQSTLTIPLSAVIDNFSFLGRSTWAGISNITGSISEFRIYGSALGAADILGNYYAGPDALLSASASATTTATAPGGDAPLTVSGIPFSSAEGVSSTSVVASVNDPDPSANAGQYTANINWGDGTSSAGSISQVLVKLYGGFQPSGSGAPFSRFITSFTAANVQFGASQNDFNWHPFSLGTNWGADITGVLNVQTAGTYTFSLTSDDGSQLYIDNNLVVNDSNIHGPYAVSGSASLTAGPHTFEIQFFEASGGLSGLDLSLPSGVAYGSANVPGAFFVNGTHTYSEGGNYSVTTTVTDVNGSSSSGTGNVSFDSPVANITGIPSAMPEGSPVTLGGSVNYPNSSDTDSPYTYAWTAQPTQAGKALHFNGNSSYVEVLNSPSLHSDRQLTLTGWFKVDALAGLGWQNILWKGNTPDCGPGCSNREYGVWIYQDGFIHFASTSVQNQNSGQYGIVSAPGLIVPGQWYNFAAVINADANFMGLYLNGQLVASGGYDASGIRTSTAPLRFGANPTGPREFFHGSMDNLEIWNVAQSQSQIQANMGTVLTGNEAGLMGYWPMDEGTGIIVHDRSPHHNDGAFSPSATGVQQGAPGALPGDPDPAYRFTGGQVVLNLPQLNTSPGGWTTVSFWMNWDGSGNWQMPIGFRYYDLLLAGGNIGFNTAAGDLYGASSAGLANRWVYITAAFTNGAATQNQLWINGVQQSLSQVFGSTGSATVSTTATISGWPPSTDPQYRFHGSLDEVAFFNRLLTQTEIGAEYGAASTGTYPSTILSQAPIGYYRLDETGGTTVFDKSGNHNDGYLSTGISQGIYGPPTGDTAYAFSGGRVDLTLPQLNTGPGNWTTVSFWMYWNGTDNIMPIGFTTYDLWLVGGAFGFNTGQGDVYGISSASLPWHYVYVTAAFTNGPATQDRLWINGVEQTLSQIYGTAAVRTVTTNAAISGWTNDANFRFNGGLSEVAFFNRLLTQAEISAEYNAANGGNYAATILGQGPVGYYRLGESSGTIAFDSSAYGNNGYLDAGQPLWVDSTAPIGLGTPVTGSGSSFTFTPPTGGHYLVNLTVTDEDGTSTTTASVLNVPVPTIMAPANQSATEGMAATFQLGSFTDPGSDSSWSAHVNWGDGTADSTFGEAQPGSLGALAHTFADDGVYTVTEKVTGHDGDVGTATFQVTVAQAAPGNLQLVLNSPTVNVNDTVALSGSFTDPGLLDTHAVEINWGDGSSPIRLTLPAGMLTFTVPHQFPSNQAGNVTYPISVTVRKGESADSLTSGQLPDLLALDFAKRSIHRYNGSTGAYATDFVPSTTVGVSDLGIIYGPDGNLYVAAGNSILRFDGLTGAPLPAAGNSGAYFVNPGSGGLGGAEGQCFGFGPDGNLYVASAGTNSILRFDGTTGSFLNVFVTPGSGGLNGPQTPIFGPDGNLYVSSYYNSSIVRYNGATGAPLPSAGNSGAYFVPPGEGGLAQAQQLLFGPDGNLYVASSSVFRFNGSTGAPLPAPGHTGAVFVPAGPGGLSFFGDGMVFGPDGNLYVGSSSGAGGPILRFDAITGLFINIFVPRASGGAGTLSDFVFMPQQTAASTQVTVNNPPVIQLSNLSFSPAAIGENATTTLAGTYTDPGVLDAHVVDIQWGDGAPITAVGLPATNSLAANETFVASDGSTLTVTAVSGGSVTFSVPHRYLDNPGNGNSGQYAAQVAVRDQDGAAMTGPGLLVASANAILRYDGLTGAFSDTIVPGLSGALPAQGAVYGPDGNLYSMDPATGAIVRYDGHTGALISSFVAPASQDGVGPAQPSALIFGPDYNLYVADTSNSSVLRFSGSNGMPLPAPGQPGAVFVPSGSAGLDQPDGLAFGPDGNLYVSSSGSNTILRYSGSSGAPAAPMSIFAGPGGLQQPGDLAFGPTGNLYVLNLGSANLVAFEGPNPPANAPAAGTLLGTFVATGSGGLTSPAGFVFGPDGNVYVADSSTGSVLRYSGASGAFLNTFVAAGSAGLNAPTTVLITPTGPQATATITVNNVAPTIGATTVFPATINEAQSTTLTSNFTDPGPLDSHTVVLNWGDGTSDTISLLATSSLTVGQTITGSDQSIFTVTSLDLINGVVGFKNNHQYLDNPPGQPNGSFAISVKVTDQDGTVGTATTSVTVQNVPPVASLPGPSNLVVGQPVQVAASDPSPVDQAAGFYYLINFGDGTSQVVQPTANNGTGLSVPHTYAPGSYTITVTALDKDNQYYPGYNGNASNPNNAENAPTAMQAVTVAPAAVQGSTLAVGGGAVITVTDPPGTTAPPVTVTETGGSVGNFSQTFQPTFNTITIFSPSGSQVDTSGVVNNAFQVNLVDTPGGSHTYQAGPTPTTLFVSGQSNDSINLLGSNNSLSFAQAGGAVSFNAGLASQQIMAGSTLAVSNGSFQTVVGNSFSGNQFTAALPAFNPSTGQVTGPGTTIVSNGAQDQVFGTVGTTAFLNNGGSKYFQQLSNTAAAALTTAIQNLGDSTAALSGYISSVHVTGTGTSITGEVLTNATLNGNNNAYSQMLDSNGVRVLQQAINSFGTGLAGGSTMFGAGTAGGQTGFGSGTPGGGTRFSTAGTIANFGGFIQLNGTGNTVVGSALVTVSMSGGGNTYVQNVDANAFSVLQQAINSSNFGAGLPGGGTGFGSGTAAGGTKFGAGTPGGGTGFGSGTPGGGTGFGSGLPGGNTGFGAGSSPATTFTSTVNGLPAVGGTIVLDGGHNTAFTSLLTDVTMTGGGNTYVQSLNANAASLLQSAINSFGMGTSGGTTTFGGGTSAGSTTFGAGTPGGGTGFGAGSGPSTTYTSTTSGLPALGGTIVLDGGNNFAVGSTLLNVSMTGGGNTYVQAVDANAFSVLQHAITNFGSGTAAGGTGFGAGSAGGGTTFGAGTPGGGTGFGSGSGPATTFQAMVSGIAALGGTVVLDGGNNAAETGLFTNVSMTGGHNFYQQSFNALSLDNTGHFVIDSSSTNFVVTLINQAIASFGSGTPAGGTGFGSGTAAGGTTFGSGTPGGGTGFGSGTAAGGTTFTSGTSGLPALGGTIVLDGGNNTAYGSALLNVSMTGGSNTYVQNVDANAFTVLQQAITTFGAGAPGGGTGFGSGTAAGGTKFGAGTPGGGTGFGSGTAPATTFNASDNGLTSVGGTVVLDGGDNRAQTGLFTNVSMTGGHNLYVQSLQDFSDTQGHVVSLLVQSINRFGAGAPAGGTGFGSGTAAGGTRFGSGTSPATTYTSTTTGLPALGGTIVLDGGNNTAYGSALVNVSMTGGSNTYVQNVDANAFAVLKQGILTFGAGNAASGTGFGSSVAGGGPTFGAGTPGGGTGFTLTASGLAALGGTIVLDGGNNRAQTSLMTDVSMTGGNNLYVQSLYDLNDSSNYALQLVQQAINTLGAASTSTYSPTGPAGVSGPGFTATINGILTLGGAIALDGGSNTAYGSALLNLGMDGGHNTYYQTLDANTMQVLQTALDSYEKNLGVSAFGAMPSALTSFAGTVTLNGGSGTATGSLLLNLMMDGGYNLYTGTIDATSGPFLTALAQAASATNPGGLGLPAASLGVLGNLVALSGGHNTAQAGPLTNATIGGGEDSFIEQLNADAVTMVNTLVAGFASASDQGAAAASLGPKASLGNGDDVVVGGWLGNFTAGNGNDRFVIEDPNLLGASNVSSQLSAFGATFGAGTGPNTFYFVGHAPGSIGINQAAAASNGTLDFSSYQSDPTNPVTGINLTLNATGSQTLASGLSLSLSSSSGFSTVIGTAGSDTFTTNGWGGQIQGAAPVDDRYLNPPAWQGAGQVVFLDFNTFTYDASGQPLPGKHVYMATEQSAILTQMQANFALFPFITFTLQRPASGPYSTLFFNKTPVVNGKPEPGGRADGVDYRDQNRNDTAAVDVNGLIGGAGQPPAQFTDASGNVVDSYVTMTATIGSHELEHLMGDRHDDATMIGFGVHNPPGGSKYVPPYPGPAAAWETTQHIIASPVTVGSTLLDAADHPYIGAREAIKLAFIQGGTVIDDTQNPVAAHASLQTAQSVPLVALRVPNAQTQGFYAGKVFSVSAIDVVDTIALDPATHKSQSNFYAFSGRAGDLMSFDVMSQILPRITNPIDSVLRIYDAAGNLLTDYYHTPAVNDDEFETGDAAILDFTLPADGTYYVEVDTFSDPSIPPTDPHYTQAEHDDTATGTYELLMYRFSAGNSIPAGAVDTIVAQGVNDTTTTVADAGSSSFVLTDTHLTGSNINLVNVHNAVLKGSSSGTTFDLSAWTGNATLMGRGGINTVILNPNYLYTATGTGFTYTVNGNLRTITLIDIQSVQTPGGVAVSALSPVSLTEGATPPSQLVTFIGSVSISYAASVNWGDGEVDNFPVNAAGSGLFRFTAAKTAPYADDGTYTIQVTISQNGNPVGSASTTATVLENDLTVTAATSFNAIEGQSFSGQPVATFSDSSALSSDTFTALIDWGDGTQSPGVVAFANGAGQVSGGHSYPEEGLHHVTVYVTENGNAQVNDSAAPATVTVMDAPLSLQSFTPPAAVEGISTGVQTLATFTDTNAVPDLADYTAIIAWGDGKVDTATQANGGLVLQGGVISVLGTHTYNEEGPENFTVTITDAGGASIPLASSSKTIADADAPLTVTGQTINPVEGAAASNLLVATFTDADPNGVASDYVASINWGDGDTTAGYTIVPDSQVKGQFDVLASKSHPYAEEGTETLSVTVTDIGDGRTTSTPGVSNATAKSTDKVADAGLVPVSHTLINLVEGTSFTGVVASFTDADPNAAAADFTVLVQWGDGSSSTVTSTLGADGSQIVPDNGGFDIKATHVYAEEGGYNITSVVVDDGDGRGPIDPSDAAITVKSTATVNDAPLAPISKTVGPVQGIRFTGVMASFTDADPNARASDFTALVQWGDGSSSTVTSMLAADGSQIVADGSQFDVIATHIYVATGTEPVTVTVIDNGDGRSLTNASDEVTTVTSKAVVVQSIYVLDGAASGALAISGNAAVKMTGNVDVDSSSASALTASGTAKITAAGIQVVGQVQRSGSPTFSPAPVTGAGVVSDPLAYLLSVALPTGMAGAVNIGGSTIQTLQPGIYSQISISGSAVVTFQPGLYVIQGGGFAVSGSASVVMANGSAGSGVTIYNGGNASGKYGSIQLSGNGTFNLTAATTATLADPFAGAVIIQPPANTRALTISGNAATGLAGAIYAPSAQLLVSGNGQLNATLVVDKLSLSGNVVANAVSLSNPAGGVAYSPAQIRTAYGISSLALDGTGQTIAIVDAYDNPAIFQALDAFDNQFGLTSSGPTLYQQYGPASSFLTVLNQNGQSTALPGTDPTGAGFNNWEAEEALDVEWAHALAPGAQVLLVEANSQSLPDLMAAVATAASQPGVSVVSMSWGFPEGQTVFQSDEALYDSYFTTPGVTFVASTGDYGVADPEYPAFSPNVLAVGGTTLNLNTDSSYSSESGWGYYSSGQGTFIGSGGGISQYEAEPAYQLAVQSTGSRTTPDVALVADPATGAWIADPYNLATDNPFEVVGGTSLSAPSWAGLVALVDQGLTTAGEPVLNRSQPTNAQQALYNLPQNDYQSITTGSNGYSAGPGYNLVTGLGTPVANLLVGDLIAYQSGAFAPSGPTVGHITSTDLVNSGAGTPGANGTANVFALEIVGRYGAEPVPGRAPSAAPLEETFGGMASGTPTKVRLDLRLYNTDALAPATAAFGRVIVVNPPLASGPASAMAASGPGASVDSTRIVGAGLDAGPVSSTAHGGDSRQVADHDTVSWFGWVEQVTAATAYAGQSVPASASFQGPIPSTGFPGGFRTLVAGNGPSARALHAEALEEEATYPHHGGEMAETWLLAALFAASSLAAWPEAADREARDQYFARLAGVKDEHGGE
jgi:hypothetical protein